jgi:NodT family efflux transporter outer membrane factor (OMF) lipoprotein
MMHRFSVLLCLSVIVLSGCAVGPDFIQPAAPKTDRYTKEAIDVQTASADTSGGESQHFANGQDIPGEWWALFHSEALNVLVKEALKNSPSIESAQAALRAARENVYAQEGDYFPSISGNFSPTRQKISGSLKPRSNPTSQIYNLDTAQVNVSYSPDVFGLTRRSVESLDAQAEAQRFQLEATRLTLTSNVVSTAIQEASLRGQIQAVQQTIHVETELLDLLNLQERLGKVSQADTAIQEAALAQAEHMLPTLQKQLAISRDQLSALLGRLPSDEPSEIFEFSSLHLPEELPLSLPAKLVEQRPDIRAAQEILHSASARVGVAVANRLPNITIDASGGSAALALGKLFANGNGFWSLAGGITQPIFEGGTLLHKERAARATLDQAAAEYRTTVINAFQNVADTLHALQSDAQSLKAASHAEHAAKHSIEIVRKQFSVGSVAYLSVLSAEQTYLQAVINRVQAQASRFADTTALFQALGGGWWNRPYTTADNSESEASVDDLLKPSKQGDSQ